MAALLTELRPFRRFNPLGQRLHIHGRILLAKVHLVIG
jgi:hypothetical protein